MAEHTEDETEDDGASDGTPGRSGASGAAASLQERIAGLPLATIGGVVALIVLVAAALGFVVRGQIGEDSSGNSNEKPIAPVNARVIGRISAVTRTSITVTDTNGGRVTVDLGPESLVMSATNGSPNMIRPGSKALLVTLSDKQATRVILVPADTPIGKIVKSVRPGSFRFAGPTRKNRQISTIGATVNIATPAPVRVVRPGAAVVVFGSTRASFFGGPRPSRVGARAVVVVP